MPCFISISLSTVPKSVRSSELTRALARLLEVLDVPVALLPAAAARHVRAPRRPRPRRRPRARVAAACTARRARGRIRAPLRRARLRTVERADVGLATGRSSCTLLQRLLGRVVRERDEVLDRRVRAQRAAVLELLVDHRGEVARVGAPAEHALLERVGPRAVERLLQRGAHRVGPAPQLAHRLQVLRHRSLPENYVLAEPSNPPIASQNWAPLLSHRGGSPSRGARSASHDRRRALGSACSTCRAVPVLRVIGLVLHLLWLGPPPCFQPHDAVLQVNSSCLVRPREGAGRDAERPAPPTRQRASTGRSRTEDAVYRGGGFFAVRGLPPRGQIGGSASGGVLLSKVNPARNAAARASAASAAPVAHAATCHRVAGERERDPAAARGR